MNIKNIKLNIVFFGTPDFVIPVVENLHQQFSLVGIVTAPDTFQGRKKTLTPTPVKKFAQEKKIRTIITLQQLENEIMEQLRDLNPDLFVVAAYGKIIPSSILEIPRFGSINIHPSLLPKYRGPSPIQSALLAGETESGVTIIKMDEKMDHGPILSQEKISLSPADTFASLHQSLFRKAAEIIIPTIERYVSGELKPKPQDHSRATYCKLITKAHGYFPVDSPPSPEQLDRMIRAYYPWPTAWTRIRIKNNELRIMKLLPDTKVQLEGRNVMELKELLNGYPELKETIKRILNLKS